MDKSGAEVREQQGLHLYWAFQVMGKWWISLHVWWKVAKCLGIHSSSHSVWKGVWTESGREVILEITAVVYEGKDGSLESVSLSCLFIVPLVFDSPYHFIQFSSLWICRNSYLSGPTNKESLSLTIWPLSEHWSLICICPLLPTSGWPWIRFCTF